MYASCPIGTGVTIIMNYMREIHRRVIVTICINNRYNSIKILIKKKQLKTCTIVLKPLKVYYY